MRVRGESKQILGFSLNSWIDGATLTEMGHTLGRVHMGVKPHGSGLTLLTLRCPIDLSGREVG